jgi:ELWxxDGT repeat protein
VELWRSDGTEAGTRRVLEVPGLRLFGYAVAGRHFFVTVNGAAFQSKEFWAADGTTGGVGRILRATTEVRPDMIPIGDNVVFTLSDSQYGLEPWWSDGTPAGTHRIADLCPGPCNSFFGATPYGGRAMLLADDGTSGLEPWLTDGTAAGTRRLGDLCPGACDSELFDSAEVNGWLILVSSLGVWLSDGSADGAFQINSGRSLSGDPISFWATELILLPHHLLIATQEPSGSGFAFGGLWSLPVTAPLVPAGDWLTSDRVPGFRFKVRIAGAIPGRPEPACIAETLCVSGALPGRTEVFVRVIGPRPNGYLWPTLVRFTPSLVEVWIEQTKTGTVRHYRLNGLSRDDSDLSGLVDRQGFRP